MLGSSKRLQLAPSAVDLSIASKPLCVKDSSNPSAKPGSVGAKRSASDSAITTISPPPLIKRRLVHTSPSGSGKDDVSSAVSPIFCANGCVRGNVHVGLCLTADGVQPPNAKLQHAAAKQWAHRDDDWIWSVLEDVDSTHAPSPDDEQ